MTITKPLRLFAPPTVLLDKIHSISVSSGTLVVWTLYIIFVFWIIYTLIIIYHWLRYSHAPSTSLISIIVHLFISFALMSLALSSSIAV